MKNILTLFILSVLLSLNCMPPAEPVPEAFGYGDYYIINNTADKLIVRAYDLHPSDKEADLFTNEINSGGKVQIYSFYEGSGGHLMPSNAFSSFYVYSDVEIPANLIYSGVNNDDWIFENSPVKYHAVYNLTIE